ncbi:MAG: hypothetical protein GF331_10845 [Chitinivibrionales bacterium]|nr:hypothetical protein [Chitinivibrionales bacterium]
MRAVLLGLVGVTVVAGFTYFNDWVLRQTFFVGNNMPISVYGGLIVFLLLVNPVLFAVRKRFALSRRELVIVLAMTLAACAVPGAGLMRTLPPLLVMPKWHEKSEPGWQKHAVLEQLPDQMLVNGDDDPERVYSGYVQGLALGKDHIAPSQVPWRAWIRPLLYWLPLVLTLWAGLIALSVVVHRQWADHEHLPYPIATFANELLPGPGQSRGSVFASRLFWIGALTVLTIHLVNYINLWDNNFLKIPTKFDFRALGTPLFPSLTRGGGLSLLHIHLYFTPLALAYFLSSDVSFSIGIGPFLFATINGMLLAAYGVNVAQSGTYIEPSYKTFLNFGAYLGLGVVIVYSGRFHYMNVLRRAFLLPTDVEIEKSSVWAARVFLFCMALFILILSLSGVEWQLAVPYTVMTVVIFMVLARVLAETGLFFMQPYAAPIAVLWGLFGARALGPHQMLLLLMITAVLMIDPRSSLMPFVVNALKQVDLGGESKGKAAVLSTLAVIVALVVAVPTMLYIQYDRGVGKADGHAVVAVPQMPFKLAVQAQQRLAAQGTLESATAISGWQRFAAMKPQPGYVVAFAVTLALVLLCYTARLFLPRWPIHPAMFIFWTNTRLPIGPFAVPFLIGGLVKTLVVKYGGQHGYRIVKPLMFGLVAGDMLGGLIPMIIGLIYYLVTGEPPKKFAILPT